MTDKKKKFLFDLHDFEREAEEAKEKRKNKTPPAPTFSLDDMEAARTAAFEKGREKGLEQAKDSIEQQTELLVQSLGQTLADLQSAEQKRHDIYLNHAVSMTYKTVSKMLPLLLDETKDQLIKTALHEFFTETTLKNPLTLFIHPSMKAPLEKYIQTVNHDITIMDDETLNPTQTRVEWQNGAFEFKPDHLMERILQTIQGRLIEDAHDVSEQILDAPEKKPHNEIIDTEKQDS